jgi:hypothetical protein
MRRFQSINRSHRVLKKGHIEPAACKVVICEIQEIRIVMDQNDIRRHPSRFLHELGDFGPDLDAIRMLFDWLVVATHVVRAQRSLNLGQEPPHVVRYVSPQNS